MSEAAERRRDRLRLRSWAALAASVLLPGSGQLILGRRRRGVRLVMAWACIQGFNYLVRGRLYAGGKALDDWVAAGAFAAIWLSVWIYALRDTWRVARRAASAGGQVGAEMAQPRADARVAERTVVGSVGRPGQGIRSDPELAPVSLSPALPVPPSGREEGGGGGAGGAVEAGAWAIAMNHFKRNRLAVIGLVVVAALYAVAVLAPLIAPYNPIAQHDLVRTGYLPPSPAHWLGTDRFGRDVLSRILYGARISLSIGFLAVAIAVVLGSALGAAAGYLGGWLDAAIMRFTDMVLAFPRLVLLIMIVALFNQSITLIILVLGLTQWPGTARLVRGEVLSLREREFIQAAYALGFKRTRIIVRHLIPNVLAPVIVAATLGIGNTIVLEAGLSFLGLGVRPPTPSWGNMVADGRQNLLGAWWVATFPGLVIVLTVLAFNLVGDGLRDAMDPRLRR
jgi:peptide/nickel transport system permease protein